MIPSKDDVRLPGLAMGVDEVYSVLNRQPDRAGPFLIIGRACGLALDTAFAVDNGSQALTWPPHGHRHQLWYLGPTGVVGEVSVVSAANGLALDATSAISGDIHPVLWEPNGEPWQRWYLQEAPDGAGYLIQSAHNRRYLTLNDEAEPRWSPWFEDRHGRQAQQWLVALPHGPVSRPELPASHVPGPVLF
ncbi:RICIN domain-containing protein [Dactylosporangium vinaceum]|uniref:RICIN domain-containing protein n=1 Tax=Dactylosporangium vinaceum TaxID=53362 RepID=A0ABV5MT29_9ACTN|nr:RICIN domain-containing protein [Dactylosporangium vinaceum]UAC00260.1 RICIN domain-containing protein [Dactylosporangium vinaceum]